jgi:hypothetical protein
MSDILKSLLDDMEAMRNMYPTQLLQNTNHSEQIINTALAQTKDEFLMMNPDIDKENCDFYQDVYKKLNPANQLLFHIAFFYGVLNEYKKLLKPKYLLKNEFPVISRTEYQDMSSHHRGAFAQYGKDSYILRGHSTLYPETFLGLNKKNQKLFKRAAHLIDVVQYENFCIKYNPESMIPLFTDDPKCNSGLINGAYLPEQFGVVPVSKKRLKTLDILYATFAEIDKNLSFYQNRIVTNNYKNDPIKSRHGAWDIFIEYRDELTQKNFFKNQQDKINMAKKAKRVAIRRLNKAIKKHPNNPSLAKKKEAIIVDYQKAYQQIISATKEKVF